MDSQTVCKSFYADLDAIIELYAGYGAYFAAHPEEEYAFFHNKEAKSRDMFLGKKTEGFSALLNALDIELDAAYLEAEYEFTDPGEGKVYKFENGDCSISFDFYIDPTAQIETCAVSLSFPKEKEDQIVNMIRQLQKNCVYAVPKIYDGDLTALYIQTNNQKSLLRTPLSDCRENLFGEIKNKPKFFSEDRLKILRLIAGLLALALLIAVFLNSFN